MTDIPDEEIDTALRTHPIFGAAMRGEVTSIRVAPPFGASVPASASAAAMTDGWERERGVTCVVMPCCGFTFDARHTDEGGGYSCPLCSDAATLRTSLDQVTRAARDVLDETCGGEFSPSLGVLAALRRALASGRTPAALPTPTETPDGR